MSLPFIPGQEDSEPLPPHRFILRYLTDTCTIVYMEPLDQYSEPPATPRTLVTQCRMDYKRRRVLNQSGQEVVSEGLLFLPPLTPIGFKDRILFDGRLWNIMTISRQRYKRRLSHLEVALA